jgi:hypothetical protein
LWQEVQNVQIDQAGHYEVMLGATGSDGIPMELFTTGEPRWLGVQVLLPGTEEEPRVLMVSVPYALEAADAQTLGGFPAAAFARAAPSVTSGAETVIPNTGVPSVAGIAVESPASLGSAGETSAITGKVGPVNVIPKYSGAGLANSQITDAGGTVSLQNLANILFADRFPGGVPDAVEACPANGCIIYALSPAVNLNLGNIDPGFKAITIYLGPYTYTVKQIMLRQSLKIIGMGASGGTQPPTCSSATPCNGTTLQSINGNNPVFVVPQTNNTPVSNLQLSGFQVIGSAGNTNQDGFFLDTSSSVNSGLWFSTIEGISLSGFAGIGIHIRGRNSDFLSATQWILFNNVVVTRNSGGGNALRLEGAVFELRFRNCEFDGQAPGDGTNIYIGGLSGGSTGYPLTVVFEGLVSQAAGLAVYIDGAVNLAFYGSHHEKLWGGYHIVDTTLVHTKGLTISDTNFAANVGVNGGSGYALNVDATTASGIFFVHNRLYGNPDFIVKGTNIASVVYQDNLCCETLNGPNTSGITTQVLPANSINILGVHSIGLNASSTPITTIQSGLGPGEMVTFFSLGGPVTFGSGGNIDLMGMSTLTVDGTITFVRTDLGGVLWKPVSQWSPTASVPTAQSQKATDVRRPAGSIERTTLAASRPGSAREK